MIRSRMVRWFLLSMLLALFASPAIAETIELVTYYPTSSNQGDLNVKSLTVGAAYNGVPPPADGQVFIFDRLGIGPDFTAAAPPTQALEVEGNALLKSPATALYMADRGANTNYSGLQLLTAGALKWTIGSRNNGTENLHIFSDADNVTRLFIAQGTGNVGIGTTDPKSLLHLSGTNPRLTFTDTSTALSGSNPYWVIRSVADLAGPPAVPGEFRVQSTADFSTFTDRFVIDANGLIYVGPKSASSSARRSVNVVGTVGIMDPLDCGLYMNNTRSGGGNFSLHANLGNSFTIADDTAGITRVTIGSTGNVGIGAANPPSKLTVMDTISGLTTGLGFSSQHTPGVTAGGVINSYDLGTNFVRPLTLQTNGGNVGIGTTTPSFTLHVNGTAGKPGGGSWSIASDLRLKKDVQPLSGALDQMLALHGVTFKWKEPEKQGNFTGTQMGMIGQEVEKVFPQWISTDPQGYRTLTFSGFEALTVEAMRELKAENEALKRKIEVLEKRATSSGR